MWDAPPTTTPPGAGGWPFGPAQTPQPHHRLGARLSTFRAGNGAAPSRHASTWTNDEAVPYGSTAGVRTVQ